MRGAYLKIWSSDSDIAQHAVASADEGLPSSAKSSDANTSQSEEKAQRDGRAGVSHPSVLCDTGIGNPERPSRCLPSEADLAEYTTHCIDAEIPGNVPPGDVDRSPSEIVAMIQNYAMGSFIRESAPKSIYRVLVHGKEAALKYSRGSNNPWQSMFQHAEKMLNHPVMHNIKCGPYIAPTWGCCHKRGQ